MGSLERLTEAAKQEWLEGWVAGPTEQNNLCLPGTAAPDFELLDDTGSLFVSLAFWRDGPASCSCSGGTMAVAVGLGGQKA